MPFSLLPKATCPRLTELEPEALHRRGVRLLMLDFDNTVLPYTSNEPGQELLSWVERMQKSGMTLCVVSNSRKPRALPFCEQTGIGCIREAKKPFPRGIRECLRQYEVSPSEAALVGDQIFTDVLGANSAGVFSVLVRPIHLHNIWLKLRHAAEQPFIQLSKHRRI